MEGCRWLRKRRWWWSSARVLSIWNDWMNTNISQNNVWERKTKRINCVPKTNWNVIWCSFSFDVFFFLLTSFHNILIVYIWFLFGAMIQCNCVTCSFTSIYLIDLCCLLDVSNAFYPVFVFVLYYFVGFLFWSFAYIVCLPFHMYTSPWFECACASVHSFIHF